MGGSTAQASSAFGPLGLPSSRAFLYSERHLKPLVSVALCPCQKNSDQGKTANRSSWKLSGSRHPTWVGGCRWAETVWNESGSGVGRGGEWAIKEGIGRLQVQLPAAPGFTKAVPSACDLLETQASPTHITHCAVPRTVTKPSGQ